MQAFLHLSYNNTLIHSYAQGLRQQFLPERLPLAWLLSCTLMHPGLPSHYCRSSLPVPLRGSGSALNSGTMRLYSGSERFTPVMNSLTASCFAASQ
mgnify:CR=1 FL=1